MLGSNIYNVDRSLILQLGNKIHSNESLSYFTYCVYVAIKIELSSSK